MSSPSSPDGLAIHLDLVGGLAGDMFVAAIVDALPELRGRGRGSPEAVRPEGAPVPGFVEGESAGLRARRFGLPESKYRLATPAREGTSYVELRDRLMRSPLADGTRQHALAILALLAGAEATVHGTDIDRVHFHEIADWDSLADVAAAGCIAARLEGAVWSASAIPLGGGRVKTAHGLLPVPAPATAALLEVIRSATTASRASASRPPARSFAISCRRSAAAWWAARCRPPSQPQVPARGRARSRIANVVRALVFERGSAAPDVDGDVVTTVEFDVDDMTGEEMALAADRLRAVAGVLDVTLGTRMGKKGRPATDFRVLARGAALAAVTRACFAETSTLGLRVRDERRLVLRRTEVHASVGGGSVAVKVAQRPDGARTAKAAHDDVASDATLDARRGAGPRPSTARSRIHRDERRAHAPARGARTPRGPRRGGERQRRLLTLAHVAARHAGAGHHVSRDEPRRAGVRRASGSSPRRAPRRGGSSSSTHGSWPTRYRANPVDRCYYCKTNLYARIASHTRDTIASGTNVDDLGDYRPGLRAATEHDVVHPYVEASLAKADVYALAASLGLADLARLPAQPCLASRVETGIAIDPVDLAFIDAVEASLAHALGHGATLRCRVTHAGVVVEVGDMRHASAARTVAEDACRAAGRTLAGVRAYVRGAAFIGKPAHAA